MPRYAFDYPSRSDSEARAMDDLFGLLEEHQIPHELRQHFALAVSEAFTNALVHGNRRQAEKIIHLEVEINDDLLSADITDEGSGGLDRIANRSTAGLLAEGGRGIDLIRHYTDASFSETPNGGLRVTIVMNRKSNVAN